ncbi:hypothetical protein Scep_009430 [Stephania cephalantha]|uniref:Zinc knuckle CX2CX4HX4C domain-containing protein n=1 Tax=Stephania cephalantha TaxID=152367 RepID=A0AAP0PEB8_9MAGN
MRIDHNSSLSDRGKFARIAVELDLFKPQVSKCRVADEWLTTEYDWIPQICYSCGKVGHTAIARLQRVIVNSNPFAGSSSSGSTRSLPWGGRDM